MYKVIISFVLGACISWILFTQKTLGFGGRLILGLVIGSNVALVVFAMLQASKKEERK